MDVYHPEYITDLSIIRPTLAEDCFLEALAHLKQTYPGHLIETYRALGEADYEIASYCIKQKAFGVIALDSDYIALLASVPQIFYIPSDNITIKGNDIIATLFNIQEISSYLRLSSASQLPLLACLIGNDFLSTDNELKSFHQRLGLIKPNGRKAPVEVIPNVSNFLGEGTPITKVLLFPDNPNAEKLRIRFKEAALAYFYDVENSMFIVNSKDNEKRWCTDLSYNVHEHRVMSFLRMSELEELYKEALINHQIIQIACYKTSQQYLGLSTKQQLSVLQLLYFEIATLCLYLDSANRSKDIEITMSHLSIKKQTISVPENLDHLNIMEYTPSVDLLYAKIFGFSILGLDNGVPHYAQVDTSFLGKFFNDSDSLYIFSLMTLLSCYGVSVSDGIATPKYVEGKKQKTIYIIQLFLTVLLLKRNRVANGKEIPDLIHCLCQYVPPELNSETYALSQLIDVFNNTSITLRTWFDVICSVFKISKEKKSFLPDMKDFVDGRLIHAINYLSIKNDKKTI